MKLSYTSTVKRYGYNKKSDVDAAVYEAVARRWYEAKETCRGNAFRDLSDDVIEAERSELADAEHDLAALSK